MSDAFIRTGPLMDANSYPQWARQLISDCHDAKQHVVEHELYRLLRDGQLDARSLRQFLIGGWPVVEQFALYMAQNLTKTRFARHPGEDMARRWLMRNIRVELNHADYWMYWAEAHGITLNDLQSQQVPAELHALSHWCSQASTGESLIVALAATNYAIEGVTGEWAAIVCAGGTYADGFPDPVRKRAMKWLKMHAQYDDAHPWEALEIICTLAGLHPDTTLQNELRRAVCRSYDYMHLFLDRCMELSRSSTSGRTRLAMA